MVKVIASDLDGTLLLHGAKELNPEIYDIILELKKHGIIFISASGRQLDSQKRLFAPIVDELVYVAENGALCLYNGETIITTEIERELCLRVVDEISKYPGCKPLISCADCCYILSGDDAYLDHVVNVVKNTTKTVDRFEDITEPFLKIAYFRDENIAETAVHFQKCFSKDLKVVTSGNCWVDLLPYDCNKATALRTLLQRMHVDPKDVISFGDQQNDVEMLDMAGISYAMEEAVPEAKACADYITDSVEKTLLEILKNLGK